MAEDLWSVLNLSYMIKTSFTQEYINILVVPIHINLLLYNAQKLII